MLKIIPGLLNHQMLAAVTSTAMQSEFVDGKLSAGIMAKPVKNNEEARIDRERLKALNRIVIGAYMHNETFLQHALPYRMAEPYYARYQSGMFYGTHVDDPVMGTENRYRSDISTTLFLSEPGDYKGGELCLETPLGQKAIKLQAGDAVIYPSSYLHRVEEVESGERLVAVSWIQSLVRQPDQRQILSDLASTRAKLSDNASNSAAAATISNCHANLLRMWSDV